MSEIAKPSSCPCCSGFSYEECCLPVHDSLGRVDSAEKLMRSRYSAFVFKNAQYLFETLHPSRRADDELQKLEDNMGETHWQGLMIVATEEPDVKGCSDNQVGSVVEFVAFYSDPSASAKDISQLHERSSFVFEDGRCFYLSGDVLPNIKLQRNDSCFCGSGKKLKKCHHT